MRPTEGDVVASPETLVLLPPRKKLRKTIKTMPGPMTIERKVSPKAPKQDHEAKDGLPRLTVWERLRTNLFDDDTEERGRSK
jgi:hypothetical protein